MKRRPKVPAYEVRSADPCRHCSGTGHRIDEKRTGKMLREIREDILQMGLREMAKKLGISPTHLSDIELGKRRPSAQLLNKYLEAELLGGKLNS